MIPVTNDDSGSIACVIGDTTPPTDAERHAVGRLLQRYARDADERATIADMLDVPNYDPEAHT